jgi:hypothetical protein
MKGSRYLFPLCACVLLAQHAPAWANYGPTSDAWHGLAYLGTTAAEASVDLVFAEEIDLSDLRPRDVLWLIYPSGDIPTDELEAFVYEGGRLIVADDHGKGGSLLARFGLTLDARAPGVSQDVNPSDERLPRLVPEREHFVFFNVEEIVANHPSVLTSGGNPLLSFENPDEHLVVETRHGAGSVLAVADGSLFINEMLRRFYGNKQFAANVLRLYCPRDRCDVTLALPDAKYVGRYRRGLGMLGSAPSVFRDAGELLNRGLALLSTAVASPPRATWVILLLVLAAVAQLVLPLRHRSRLSRAPRLADPYPVRSTREVDRRGLSASRDDADFREQVSILQVESERMLSRETVDKPLIQSARLRIREALLSLEGQGPSPVTADQFLALREQLADLRRAIEVERHGSRPG